jgi:hypothetical protein
MQLNPAFIKAMATEVAAERGRLRAARREGERVSPLTGTCEP